MPTGYPQPTRPQALAVAAAAAAAASAPVPSGTVLGYQDAQLAGQVGIPTPVQATAQLPQPPDNQAYFIERIEVSSTASSATASVQVNGTEVDFTDNGQHDVAEYPPRGIWVGPGSNFSVVWTPSGGGNPTYLASVQYRIEAA